MDDRLKRYKEPLNNILKSNISSAEFKLDGRKVFTKEEAKAFKAYQKDRYKRREDRVSKHWDKTVQKLNTPISNKKRIGANMVNGVIGVAGGYALSKAGMHAFENGKYKTYIALELLGGLSTGAGLGSFERATVGLNQRRINKKYGVKN